MVNNIDKVIINNNDRNCYNQSIGTKNLLLSNNLLYNNSFLLKVINQKKQLIQNNITTVNNKNNVVNSGYTHIEKISFTFLDYLLYLLCNKKNKILKYENFKRKIISEEQIIQSYIKLYRIINVFGSNNNNDIKRYRNSDMNMVMDSINKDNI